ncbi:MAG: hypothetical protein Q7J57_13245 [Gemmobacter sp.]|nr:hypothetical protein [Gemmobacter sp.]
MPHITDTDALVAEGILTAEHARIIKARSRQTMIALAINTLLAGGVAAAALGLVVLLADAAAVAATGAVFLAVGVAILGRGGAAYRMFGNAAALIGAGMLTAGATIELIDSYARSASAALLVLGAGIGLSAGAVIRHGPKAMRFAAGAVVLMGGAMHLAGLYFGLSEAGVMGVLVPFAHFYTAVLVAVVGWLIDVRAVTALAIVPFAQMLDTSTFYFHAAYVFYSPEPTLSIVQMAVLVAVCVWVMVRMPDRIGRHAGILAIMGVIVGNLCFLVGSLWGDVVGLTYWDAAHPYLDGTDWDARDAAQDAFAARTLVISDHVFAVVWAVVLAAAAIWSAHANRRGLFNASITFGAIHAYTQAFESFGDEPLAYVIGGLATIPLAWGVWQLNNRFGESA